MSARGRVLTLVALVAAGGCARSSGAPTDAVSANLTESGTVNASLSLDSTTYHSTLNGLGAYMSTLQATFHNSGTRTLYLRRLCNDGAVPHGVLSRTDGTTLGVLWQVEGPCLTANQGSAPAPIAVPGGSTYSWTIHTISAGTRTQIPASGVTGDFVLQVVALTSSKVADSYLPSDLIPVAMRWSAPFSSIAPP